MTVNRTLMCVAVCCGLFLTAGCGVGLQHLPVGRTADGDDYRVTVELPSADNLELGAEVRLGQQVVGRIHDLGTDGHSASVGLSLSKAVDVAENVGVRVELPSALGKPFIRLLPPPEPSADSLTEGSVITSDRAEVGPQIESMLAALGMVLNGSGLDQLGTVVEETNRAFGGRGEQVRYLTDSLERTLSTVAAHQDDLNRALEAANEVAGALAQERAVLEEGLDAMSPTVQLLVEQRDRITALVDNTTTLVDNAESILDSTSGRIGNSLENTVQVLGALEGFNTEVAPALTNMNAFLRGFTNAVHGAYLVFDGALDVPGSIAKLLTGGRPETVVPDLENLLRGGAR